jgi:hypothetical protein
MLTMSIQTMSIASIKDMCEYFSIKWLDHLQTITVSITICAIFDDPTLSIAMYFASFSLLLLLTSFKKFSLVRQTLQMFNKGLLKLLDHPSKVIV